MRISAISDVLRAYMKRSEEPYGMAIYRAKRKKLTRKERNIVDYSIGLNHAPISVKLSLKDLFV